ncbi:MAG: endonuclease/exonuclease/phosphatase family protein [Planctomycetota bacterium]
MAVLAVAAAAFGAVATAAETARDDGDALLRVLSWNIRHGEGADGVDLERVARLIRAVGPDVVLLQEVDERCGRSGSVDQARFLGERLGMHHAFAPFMDYDGGRYGLAVLSRLPLVDREVVPLPAGRHEPRSALAVTIRPDETTPPLTVINVHFDWLEDDEARFAQAQAILRWQARLEHPVVLGGDLNARPGDRTVKLARERFPVGPPPSEQRATFPAHRPDREIDYVLARPAGAWRLDLYTVIEETVASDHRPVLAVLAQRGG